MSHLDRILRVLLALLLAGGVLAACSSDDDDDGASGSASGSATAAEADGDGEDGEDEQEPLTPEEAREAGDPAVYDRIAANTDCADLERERMAHQNNADGMFADDPERGPKFREYAKAAEARMEELNCPPGGGASPTTATTAATTTSAPAS